MVVAAAVIMGLSANAEYQRLPDPGVKPLNVQKTLSPQQTNFLNFVSQIKAHQSSPLEGAYGTAQPAMSMRPEKIYRSPWDPQGNIYAVVSSIATMTSYAGAHYGKLNVHEGTVSPMYYGSVFSSQLVSNLQTGFVRDGILYIPDFNQDMVTQEYYIFWKRYDVVHGKQLPNIIYGDDSAAMKMFCYAMTYDEVEDKVYVLSYDIANEMGGGLGVIDCSSDDPATWKVQSLQNVGGTQNDWMAMICWVPTSKTLYGLKSSGKLYDIDTTTGRAVIAMEYDRDMNTSCFPTFMDSCPGIYSPRDKAIIMASPDDDVQNYVIVGIDVESLEAYEIESMRVVTWVPTLYCPDPWADDEAPGEVTINSIDFEKASLSGTFNVTAPSTLFNGIAIDKEMKLHLLLDKEEVYNQSIAPGATAVVPVTTTQGNHHFTVFCSLGDAEGAKTTKKLYIGNDQPQGPTDLKYANNVLTWKASNKVGVNYGYLDLSDPSYNVYLNGKKVNDQPIKGNSYNVVFDAPSNIRSEIQVTTIANDVESEMSMPLTRVVGKGLDLPNSLAPTRVESNLFDLINNSLAAVNYYEKVNVDEPIPHFDVFTTDYHNQPNAWIFLPPMNLDSKDDIYNFACIYRNHTRNNLHKDNLDIYIGKDPLPEAMTKRIYSHSAHVAVAWTDISTNFNIEEPGAYYIGIHVAPYSKDRDEADNTTNRYRGIRIGDFKVQKGAGTSDAPGEATNVKLTPADFGDLFVTVDATLPTVSMNGKEIPANTELTLTARSTASKMTATGKPGENVHFVLPVDLDGFSDIYVKVASDAGEGVEKMYSVYTGLDTPLAPANVKSHISADNLSIDLTWDPVGDVGFNGGYVDTSTVDYDIYVNNTTTTTKVGTAGKKTSYTYNGPAQPQYQIRLGPVAVNEIGTSQNGIWANETLGTPYITPMIEEWGTGGYFNCQKWLFATEAPFNGVTWSHMTSPDSEDVPASYGNGGALQATGSGWGELRAPRVSTATDYKVKGVFRYWNYRNAAHMEVWGQTFDKQEFVKVAELDPSRPSNGEWVDWVVELPEDFANQPWIQLNIRCQLSGNQQCILDSYTVAQNVNNDLQVSSVDGPYSVFVGEKPEFNVTVTNSGAEPNSGRLVVELLGNGDVLDSQTFDVDRIRPGENSDVPVEFLMRENYINYELMEVQAHIYLDGDENPRNNEDFVEFILFDHTIPVVRDLAAERMDNGQDVKLTWSEPNRTQKDLESFEISASLQSLNKIGRWTNVDKDGLKPMVIDGKRWPKDDEPSAWIVINGEEFNTMNDDRLCPHTGKQMLMARSIQYDSDDKPFRNLDFLISPELKQLTDAEGKPVGQHVSFWMNCISSQYTETVAIWYSTTDMDLGEGVVDPKTLQNYDTALKELGSFKFLRNFTKSGADTWEECEFDLPEDAKYFAFVYSSFGQFACTIDDVKFQPAEPGLVDIDSYDVYVTYSDEESLKLLQEGATTTAYTHVTTDTRPATYYVTTNVVDNDALFFSALSNPAKVAGTGIGELEAGQFVGGGKGRVLVGGSAGVAFKLYDTEGRTLVNTIITADRQSFVVAPGVYVAKLGEASVKVIVR